MLAKGVESGNIKWRNNNQPTAGGDGDWTQHGKRVFWNPAYQKYQQQEAKNDSLSNYRTILVVMKRYINDSNATQVTANSLFQDFIKPARLYQIIEAQLAVGS